jgi:hypothetical protein
MRLLILTICVFLVQPLAAVELQEFTADYEIFYGDISLGEASYRFSHAKDSRYHFDFSSKMRFLIFSDSRTVSSEVLHEDPYLRPIYYSHDRKGTGPDYFEEIRFNRAENLIRSMYKEEIKEFEYDRAIIDGLSVQLQMIIDLQRGVKQPEYKILDSNRVRERQFSFVREEVIDVMDKEYNSVLYQLVRDNSTRKTQIWFSTEHDFIPIQMMHYKKGRKKFNARLVAVRLHEAGDGMASK